MGERWGMSSRTEALEERAPEGRAEIRHIMSKTANRCNIIREDPNGEVAGILTIKSPDSQVDPPPGAVDRVSAERFAGDFGERRSKRAYGSLQLRGDARSPGHRRTPFAEWNRDREGR